MRSDFPPFQIAFSVKKPHPELHLLTEAFEQIKRPRRLWFRRATRRESINFSIKGDLSIMKNKTDITIILDRSGSMQSVKDDTIGGFNNFLSEQQKVDGEASLSLVQFDDQYEVVYEDKNIHVAAPLSDATFQPRGSTALLDAVGRTINSVGRRLAALPETERPDKVLLVVMTDGFENASTEFTAAKIGEMINHQRSVYSWEFMFIGANQDAVLSAREIGIPAAAALTYAANTEGTQIAFSMAASKIANYRQSSNKEELEFNEEDRERQRQAGAKK
jgi:hypothetical protein